MADSRIQNASEVNLFTGNPGAGKSTLLNARAGKVLFRSGMSFGGGLTKGLDVKIEDGVAYVDTPGLADAKLRKEAAAAISMALKAGGLFKVIFVCKQDDGRVRPADITTMQLVLEACEEIGDGKFGIIVNQCSKEFLEAVSVKENFEQFNVCMQESLVTNTQFVMFLQEQQDLKSKTNALVPMTSLKGLGEFLDKMPTVRITKGKAKDIRADAYEKLSEAMEEKDNQIRALIDKMNARDEEAQKTYKELQAKFERKMEEAQKNSGPWNPFEFIGKAVEDFVKAAFGR